MVATDCTIAGMVVCLAVVVGLLIYAVGNGVTINDGNHKGLWIGMLSALVTGLITAGVHIWLAGHK
jgi:hypothetical protein